MSQLLHSPFLWRIVGGFVFGSVLTLGLGTLGETPPPSTGATVELSS